MEKTTYEITTPESIGLSRNKLVLGKHSGRHAFKERLKILGFNLSEEELEKAFERFKALADKKKTVFDEDIETLVIDEVYRPTKRFEHIQMNVGSGSFAAPTATLEMRINGTVRKTAVMGVGPVDAAFKAVKELTGIEPLLKRFTIGALTGGTDAQGDCTVLLEIEGREVMGHGLHPDIIVASTKAFINALNRYTFLKDRSRIEY